MSHVAVKDFLPGPYRDEADFKKALMERMKKEFDGAIILPIETEETVKGFPDILCLHEEEYMLYEIKFIRDDGYVKFTRGQPHFYKLYSSKIELEILAWDSRRNELVIIDVNEVLKEKNNKVFIPLELEYRNI